MENINKTGQFYKVINKYMKSDNGKDKLKILYLGSIKDNELEDLKKEYSNLIVLDTNDNNFKTNMKNELKKGNIGPIIISSNNIKCKHIVKIVNQTKRQRYIIKIPKSFEFNKFFKSVKSNYADIYNTKDCNGKKIGYYLIVIETL